MIKEVDLKASLDCLSVVGKEEDHDRDWAGGICVSVDGAEHGGPSLRGLFCQHSSPSLVWEAGSASPGSLQR